MARHLSSAVEKFKMPGVNMNAVVRKAEEYLNLPQYATGTVVPPNAAHLAIIGDNKYERELVSPESLMRQIVTGRRPEEAPETRT